MVATVVCLVEGYFGVVRLSPKTSDKANPRSSEKLVLEDLKRIKSVFEAGCIGATSKRVSEPKATRAILRDWFEMNLNVVFEVTPKR